MTNDKRGQRVLVLTVGTGNPEDLEGSLYAPLQKSIETGRWTRVALFPSQDTKRHARELIRRYAERPIQFKTYPLPEAGMEDNADACFAFFNKKLRGLLKDVGSTNVMVDFTRGTKAMSAALVLAAAAHDVPRFRYISGDRDEPSGTVTAGTENVGNFDTQALSERKQLDSFCLMLRHGRYAAALDLLPKPGLSARENDTLATLRPLADFCCAWDRLDYQHAAAMLRELPRARAFPQELRLFLPDAEVKGWVRRLAQQPARGQYRQFADWLRRVVCDVLANGQRRLCNGELEDALIRAYRVLEMLGQIRLFDKNLDSSALPESDPDIQRFQVFLRTSKERPLAKAREPGCLEAGREKAALLLKWRGDRLGERLIQAAHLFSLGTRRNQSILNHEFDAQAPDRGSLRQIYKELERLLISDAKAAKERLRLACWLAFDNTFR